MVLGQVGGAKHLDQVCAAEDDVHGGELVEQGVGRGLDDAAVGQSGGRLVERVEAVGEW
jgi:hypothetical protein